jgi:antitoxin ParD1/3/4
MNVSLTPELEKMVAEKVQSGMYNSASEVVRAGLRLLQEQDEARRLKLEALRRDIQHAVEQVGRGEVLSYASPEEFFTELTAEADAELDEELASDKKATHAA